MPIPEYSVELELGEPPGEVVQYARLHCGESADTRLQAIAELRDLIYERGECSPHRTDDEFLVRFLRARNFIPRRAHRLLVNYYRFREEHTGLFEGVYPLELRHVAESNIIAAPPYRDHDGRRLIIYRIGCWDPKVIPVDDLLKCTVLAMELSLLEQRTQILGGVALIDLEEIGMQHTWQVTPSLASKIVRLLVSSFPASEHAIHIINHSWIFDKMYSIFRPFLSPEMQARIYFHGNNFDSLHKHVLPEYLPERYGGMCPEYPYTIWLESLRKNYKVFKELIDSGYRFRESDLDPAVVRQLQEKVIKLS